LVGFCDDCNFTVSEIPLFHVLNARITFGNIFGLDEEIPGVTRVVEEDRISCIVDDSCFVPPASYSRLGKCLLFMANPIGDIL
jgi:septin 4